MTLVGICLTLSQSNFWPLCQFPTQFFVLFLSLTARTMSSSSLPGSAGLYGGNASVAGVGLRPTQSMVICNKLMVNLREMNPVLLGCMEQVIEQVHVCFVSILSSVCHQPIVPDLEFQHRIFPAVCVAYFSGAYPRSDHIIRSPHLNLITLPDLHLWI